MRTPVLKATAFGGTALLVLILVCATMLEKLYGTPFALSNIYHSEWFIALWALLAVSAMAYTLRASRRFTLIMLHASFVVILLGAFLSFLTSQHGSILLAKEAVPASMFTADNGKLEKLPFSLQLADIDTIYRNNSTLPCDYKASVIVNNRKESQELTVSLNNPIKREGYSLCIKGVQEGHLSLLVAHDSVGLYTSYIGYAMMFFSFIALLLDKQSMFCHLLRQLQPTPKTKKGKENIQRSVFAGKLGQMLAIPFIMLCFAWYKRGMFPVTNGAESLFLLAFAMTMLAVFFKMKKIRRTLIIVACLLAFATSFCFEWNSSVQPILRSPLLGIHVTTIIIAYALICCTAINAIIALLCKNEERMKSLALVGHALLYPATILLATGIFIGAIWANISWGRYWGWDPKEVWALATLLVCSFTFHTHSLPFMAKPRFFHIYCIAIALMMLFTYLGVSFLLGGMHSYM